MTAIDLTQKKKNGIAAQARVNPKTNNIDIPDSSPAFTYSLDPNPSQKKKKDGKPFKPCPRTDCVENQTKHAQLTLLLKEAKENLAKEEGLLRVAIAETESYDQRLQAARTNLKAYDTIIPQLEAKYIEEKRKNANCAELETKRLELKQKMTDQQTIYDLVEELQERIKKLEEENALIEEDAIKGAAELVEEEKKALREEFDTLVQNQQKKISDLEEQCVNTDRHIEMLERYVSEEQKNNNAKESQITELEESIQKLETEKLKHESELMEAVKYSDDIAFENGELREKLDQAVQDIASSIEVHQEAMNRLEEKLAVQENQYKTLERDSKGVQGQIVEAEKKLDEKKVEIEVLTTKLQKTNVEFVGGGGGVPQKTLDQYVDMVRGLTGQVQAIHGSQKPQFNRDVDAYRSEGSDEKRETPELASSSSSTTTTSSPSSETKSTHDEGEEEEVPANLQLIYRARRDRGGPIQHVHHEVPIPGPTIYLETPGENIPGPIRYTPFRVFAHNPITCWLLVEFNFLVLFIHWIKRLLSLLSWIPGMILGGGNWTPPSPDYLSSSSDTDSDAAGAPPRDADGPQRSQPGVFSALFRPKPGRIPSARNTSWGLAFHICVYSTLWLSFSVWEERQLWLAENDGTRRWLIAQRGSNGFLDMNQMLPQRVNRQLDIMRYGFLELVGIPLTYQSPG